MRNIQERQERFQSRFTIRWIERDGIYIALKRPPVGVSDGAGAMVTPNVPPINLPPVKRVLTGLTQVGRGVNQQPERWIVTSLGKRYKRILVMIGPPDDDVQGKDYWIDDQGERNEVVFVHEDRSYQTKSEIIIVA
jgi:hypothetical protein